MKALKSIYIIVIFAVTALIIGAVLWFKFHNFDIARAFNSITTGEGITVEKNVDSFKNIQIDASIMSFDIAEGEGYKVVYTYPEELTPEFEVDDDTLKINVKGTNKITIGAKVNSDNFKFTVFVPAGTSLENVKVDVDAGDIDLRDKTFEKLTVDGDAANIELRNIISEKTELEADAGNIEVRESKLGNTTIKTSAGNVELRDTEALEMDIITDMGQIKLVDSAFDEGEFESSMGNVEIEGNFNKLTADCSLGRVAVESKNADAKMDISVDLGAISINGKDIKGKSYKQ